MTIMCTVVVEVATVERPTDTLWGLLGKAELEGIEAGEKAMGEIVAEEWKTKKGE